MSNYRLKPWIPVEKLNMRMLPANPSFGAIELLLNEDPERIDWDVLSENESPEAIELLRENPRSINWESLSLNPSAIKLLLENPDKIDWVMLSQNPAPEAIELLRKNPRRIDWGMLSGNTSPKAIELLIEKFNENDEDEELDFLGEFSELEQNPAAMPFFIEHPEFINWEWLSGNPTPEAIKLIRQNLANFENEEEEIFDVNWYLLSRNPYAIKLLLENPDEIDWSGLSENKNPEAIKILRKNPDKIDWHKLSANPSGINLLRENADKIDWKMLSLNPAIFDNINKSASKIQKAYRKSNIVKMREQRKKIAKETSNVLKYAPPGQFHKFFPGGEEYHRGLERWTSSHSFGKSRNGSAIAFKSSKLRSVEKDIVYLSR